MQDVCVKCELAWPSATLVKMNPCNHSICQQCFQTARNSGIQCPVCSSQSNNVNPGNPRSIPRSNPDIATDFNPGNGENIKRTGALRDQLTYLSYINNLVLMKNQEAFNELGQIWQNIDANFNFIIAEIQKIQQAAKDEINNIIQKNTDFALKIQGEIKLMYDERNQVDNQIKDFYNNGTPIGSGVTKKFENFKYPDFEFKFRTLKLDFNQGKVASRVKEIFGKFEEVLIKKNNEFSNNRDYTKFKEDNPNFFKITPFQ